MKKQNFNFISKNGANKELDLSKLANNEKLTKAIKKFFEKPARETEKVFIKEILNANYLIPVKFEGHAEGVRAGGILFTSVRYLAVKAPVEQIPEKLVVNVTPLAIGKTFKVGDLHFDGLELVTTPDALVCGVKGSRASKNAAN